MQIYKQDLLGSAPLEPDRTFDSAEFNWKTGLVILLDALGVSMFDRHNTERFLALTYILEKLIHSELESNNRLAPSLGLSPISYHVQTFGDSFLLACEVMDDYSKNLPAKIDLLHNITGLTATVLFWSMRMGLLFRGAMAIGEYIVDGSRLVGPAVNEVAAVYESPQLASVIAAPSMESQINQIRLYDPRYFRGDSYYASWMHYSTPLKTKEGLANRMLWNVDWPFTLRMQELALLKQVGKGPEVVLKQILDWYERGPKDEDKYKNTFELAAHSFRVHREIEDADPHVRDRRHRTMAEFLEFGGI